MIILEKTEKFITDLCQVIKRAPPPPPSKQKLLYNRPSLLSAPPLRSEKFYKRPGAYYSKYGIRLPSSLISNLILIGFLGEWKIRNSVLLTFSDMRFALNQFVTHFKS